MLNGIYISKIKLKKIQKKKKQTNKLLAFKFKNNFAIIRRSLTISGYNYPMPLNILLYIVI